VELGRTTTVLNKGKAKKNKKQIKIDTFQWEESAFKVAQYFGLKTEEVRRWSLMYFTYKADFIKDQHLKKAKQPKQVEPRYKRK